MDRKPEVILVGFKDGNTMLVPNTKSFVNVCKTTKKIENPTTHWMPVPAVPSNE